MAIVQTLHTASQFADAFKQSSRATQFSYEALEAIFDYLEEYSKESGEPVEFDPISICCNWYEMTWQEVAQSYNVDLPEVANDDERIQDVEDFLNDSTYAVKLSGGQSFVFVCF